MAKLLEVSKSGFYKWNGRKLSKREVEDNSLKLLIKKSYEKGRKGYGATKIQKDLKDQGVIVGRDRVHRIKSEMGLWCIQTRKFKATTNSKHKHPVASNLLDQNFNIEIPGTVVGADITYIWTDEGW